MKFVSRSLLAILLLAIIFILSKYILNQQHYKISKSEVYYIPDLPIKRDSIVVNLESQIPFMLVFSKDVKNSYDLLALDRHNDVAVRIIAYYLNDWVKDKDSIKRFFDNMIKSDPKNPAPLILRAKYEKYPVSLIDTSDLVLLKKACHLDWKNEEANYLLGILYYNAFIHENNTSRRASKLNYYAQKARHYLSLLYKFKSKFIFKGKFPLVQVCNFLGDKIHIEDFDNIRPNKKSTYFSIDSFLKLPKEWETNYKFNVLFEVKMAEEDVQFYSETLRDLKESPLTSDLYNKKIYRLTCFGPLSGISAVTIKNKNGKVDVYWKSRSIYSYNNLSEGTKELTLKDWQRFKVLIQKMEFWNIKPYAIDSNKLIPMNDGETWILEGVHKNKYNVIKKRESPFFKTPFENCCMYLYSLAGID
ncbi:MAG: hypothetical protein WCR42_09840 [bacterium]